MKPVLTKKKKKRIQHLFFSALKESGFLCLSEGKYSQDFNQFLAHMTIEVC